MARATRRGIGRALMGMPPGYSLESGTPQGRQRPVRRARRGREGGDRRRSKLRLGHPDPAESPTNTGHLMPDPRRYEEARGYSERSPQVGAEPTVPLDLRAKTLQPLGSLLQHQEHYSDARSRLSQPFGVYESAFGPNHPATKKARDPMEQTPPPTC